MGENRATLCAMINNNKNTAEIDTASNAVDIKTSSSEVTGNGWLDGLPVGEKRIRWNAWIDGEYPNGIKGSPLGRGWSEEEAIRDLVIRVMHESRIRLEPKKEVEA